MKRLLYFTLLCAIFSFELSAQEAAPANKKFSFETFKNSLQSLVTLPYRESRFLYNWGKKKMAGQETTVKENKRAYRLLGTAATGIVLTALGAGYYYRDAIAKKLNWKSESNAGAGSVVQPSVAQEIIVAAEKTINILKKEFQLPLNVRSYQNLYDDYIANKALISYHIQSNLYIHGANLSNKPKDNDLAVELKIDVVDKKETYVKDKIIVRFIHRDKNEAERIIKSISDLYNSISGVTVSIERSQFFPITNIQGEKVYDI